MLQYIQGVRNEDRQADWNPLRSAATGNDYSTGVGRKISADVKWHVVEEYGPDCFTEEENGDLYFRGEYTDLESLISWMFTFGDQVQVLEPQELKEELLKRAKNIIKKYEKGCPIKIVLQDCRK